MKTLPIVATLSLAAVALTVGVRAGGEKIAFPENYAKGVLYTTVDRPDNKQYRELYATPEAIAAVKAGQPIPSGTHAHAGAAQGQTRRRRQSGRTPTAASSRASSSATRSWRSEAGWGSEYPEEIRNGEWEYQAFKADKTVNDKANLKNCFTCHKPLDKQDFVFSFQAMKNAK